MNIDKKIVSRLITKLINPDQVYTTDNVDHIAEVIINNMDEHAQECILHLMLSDKKYKPVKIGDYVMFEPASYHKGSEYELDVLIDMGLYPGNGQVYGKVTGHSSWGIGDFHPFSSRIKVNALYHSQDKELKEVEVEIHPLKLTRITKSKIKYYKDATTITRTDQV
jgi:hypothetical protein